MLDDHYSRYLRRDRFDAVDREPKFKSGTVVRLKSGGPQMTVDSAKDREAYCQWFVGDEVRNHSFAYEALVEVKE